MTQQPYGQPYPQQQYPPQPQQQAPQQYAPAPQQQYAPAPQQAPAQQPYRPVQDFRSNGQPQGQQYAPQQAPQQQAAPSGPMPSAADVLGVGGGGGRATFKLGKKHQGQGEYRGGTIIDDPGVYHVEKPGRQGEPRQPLYYQNGPNAGQPIYGVYVDVPTDERDPANENDDGVRRIYIDGMWTDKYVSRKRAVVEAVQEAAKASGRQLSGLERGGQLHLAWTHEVDTGAASPAQSWHAQYVPPPTAAANVLMNAAPAQAAPPVQQAQSVQQAQPVQQAPVQQQYAPAPQTVQQAAPQQQYAPAPVQQQSVSQYAPQQPVQQAPVEQPVQQGAPSPRPEDYGYTREQLQAFGPMDDATLSAIGQDVAKVRAALAACPPF